MRILVTGASGFVGHHLARALAGQGHEIHALVRPSSRLDRLLAVSGLSIQVHDGSTKGLIEMTDSIRPGAIIHVAGLVVADHTPDQLEDMLRANVTFGTQLLEAARACGVTRFINTGTYWQHYQGADYDPVCLYAATKQALETIIAYYAATSNMRVLTLKLFDAYGPEDDRPKLFNLLRRAAQEGRALDMSPGEQLMDMVYIDDVVRAYAHGLELLDTDLFSSERVRSYAVGSGLTPLKDVVGAWQRVTGARLKINFGGREYRAREVMEPWRSENLPGWQAEVDLETGIRLMEADP